MSYGWKENSVLTNCLAECAHLTITVSQIERDIGLKSSFSHRQLHSTPPLRGFPTSRRNIATPFGMEKLEWLKDQISKISLFVFAQLANVTDGHRVTAYTALMHMDRAVKKLLHSSMQTSADHQSRRRHVSRMTDAKGETWAPPSGMSKVRSRPESSLAADCSMHAHD